MWPFKRKLKFDKIARFNYELDKNQKLKDALTKLSVSHNEMCRQQYISEILSLFRKEGIDISLKELDMLLILRKKTDQIILEDEHQADKKSSD